ncbi:MAG TPA: hypothetical protein VKI44_31510 [Acetobacteraceae bacterium]|nr:hypothetical protein [Acetobacteraceae bacterium]
MATWPLRPTPQDLDRIRQDVAAIADLQQQLLDRDAALKKRDRVAHQYQIAGGKVVLTIAPSLPANLDSVGLFEPAATHIGIGRVSTGLGCPHAETNPDFLGLRLAFQTKAGGRVDFIAINDPASPTDTHAQFMKLLAATAAGAGKGVFPSGAQLLTGLIGSLGLAQGGRISAHVLRQTSRAALSSTAYQTYWTGIEETGGIAGKFVIEPVSQENQHRALSAGEYHLTEEWRARQARGPVLFDIYWIPFIDAQHTSLDELTSAWQEQRHPVGTMTFPQCDPSSEDAGLWAALAAEMGANPGNWVHDQGNTVREPSTEFGIARKIAYRNSQEGRDVLPEASYAQVFRTGTIDGVLAAELKRRRAGKQDIGHIDAAP